MLANRMRLKPLKSIPPGAFLFYKFDELASASSVENFAGSPAGTRVGTVTSVAGRFGTAWNFPGTDQNVNTNIVTPSGDVSFSGWLKFNSFTGRRHIVSDVAASGDSLSPRLAFGINGSSFEVLLSDGSALFIQNTGLPHGMTTEVWYHIAYVVSGTSIKIYINGSLSYSITASVPKGGVTSTAIRLANSGAFDGGLYLNAAIDQVRIYNRALTAVECLQLASE